MFDQVHPGVASAEREHLGLVFPLPQKPRDFGDLHLEQTRVDVRGQKGGPFRADPRGDVRVVTRLVRDSLPDFPRAVPKAADCPGLIDGHAFDGHRVCATSFTASSQTSRRIESYRRSTRRVPSPLSMTIPPAQSIVPSNAELTSFRTTGSSRGFEYTLPPERHSSRFASSRRRRSSVFSVKSPRRAKAPAYTLSSASV